MKNILALDLATVTGWATNSISGAENFKKRSGDSRGMVFIRFESWLNEMIDKTSPDMIVHERPHARGRAANEVLNGLLGIMVMVCEKRGIEYTSAFSKDIKKWATGKGNASKDDMVAEFKRRTGRDPVSDDEADAYLINRWAQEQFN